VRTATPRQEEPRRNDFPGLENDPNCLQPVYASWERWLQAKQAQRDQTNARANLGKDA